MPLQRKLWTMERVGWGVLFFIVVAAMLGAFGGGYLAQATVTASGAAVSYERFGRWEATSSLRITAVIQEEPAVVLHFSPDFARVFLIEGVEPRPVSARSGSKLEYQFARPATGDFFAVVHIRPLRWGFVPMSVSIGEHRLTFWIFNFP